MELLVYINRAILEHIRFVIRNLIMLNIFDCYAAPPKYLIKYLGHNERL